MIKQNKTPVVSTTFMGPAISRWIAGALALSAVGVLNTTGCGATAFNVTGNTQNEVGAGYYTVPPKIDILLFVDDTGSMSESYSAISAQLPTFLSTLDTQNWDYHFASNSLTTPRSQIPQVVGSVYDSNHSGWQVPYPGAQSGGPQNIIASFFQTATTYSDFITKSAISNRLGSAEPGFLTMQQTLNTAIVGTDFLRPDSLPLVLVISNGDDSSNVNSCTRSDNLVVSCDVAGKPLCTPSATDPTGGVSTCASGQTSLNFYNKYFSSFRSNLKMYAMVNVNGTTSCLSGVSHQGSRYMSMSKSLNGQSIDICSQSISQVFAAVSSNLQTQRLAFRTRYLIISSAPNPSSIVVTKYLGGDKSQPQVLPQDPTNGWTYAGQIQNVALIDSPSLMNYASGYAIALNGTAKLLGYDTAQVTFTPAGAQNSVALGQ